MTKIDPRCVAAFAAAVFALHVPDVAHGQRPDQLRYVAERTTSATFDSVRACLERELRRYQPGRQTLRVTTTTQSVTSGRGSSMRGPTTTSSTPIVTSSYQTRVRRVDDIVFVEVEARTTRLQATDTQATATPVAVATEAKRIADRVATKCAPQDAEETEAPDAEGDHAH